MVSCHEGVLVVEDKQRSDVSADKESAELTISREEAVLAAKDKEQDDVITGKESGELRCAEDDTRECVVPPSRTLVALRE